MSTDSKTKSRFKELILATDISSKDTYETDIMKNDESLQMIKIKTDAKSDNENSTKSDGNKDNNSVTDNMILMVRKQ